MNSATKIKVIAVSLAVASLSVAARAQSTIRYSGVTSIAAPWNSGWRALDLNEDGKTDFSLMGRYLITTDVPPSGGSYECGISMSTGNQVLVSSGTGDAWLGTVGQTIGPASSLDPVWAFTQYWFGVTGYHDNLLAGTRSEWFGELGRIGSGYLGVSFSLADGIHYGWVAIRLPMGGSAFPPEFTPIVTGWAYEMRPDTPILAGAIPEPSGGTLLALGTALLAWRGWRIGLRRKQI